MPSPFPGMDPWLERPMLFPGVHNALVIAVQAALNRSLPQGYVCTNANRVWVDIESRREPDASIYGPAGAAGGDSGVAVAAMTQAGLLAAAVDPKVDPVEELYLEILSDEGDELITAVEVVSLSNKRAGDDGRVSYQHKRQEYRASGVNLVEIDLLRGGLHTTGVPESRLRAVGGGCEYHVSVLLAGPPSQYFVAPIRLTDRLPVVPVPLRWGVQPVPVDLRAAFDRVYDEGRYTTFAKYERREPDPPLTPDQQAWADEILRSKGLKP